MINQTLVGITAQIAADCAKAIRGLNLDKINWQRIYTGTGDITVTLPDGTSYNGPAWNSITTVLAGKADLTNGAVAVSQGGTGATTAEKARTNLGVAYGNAAGTVAQGNDSRLTTVNGKTGGRVEGGLGVSSNNNVNMGLQGSYMAWNEDGGSGTGSVVVNPGDGTGGFRVRLINSANTTETARFEFTPGGYFYAPNGSYSVSGRVRAFSGIDPTYLEVIIDGSAKGINFFDSDINLKENIVDVSEGSASKIIRKIRPVSYKFKDTTWGENGEHTMGGATHSFGVIAQELEKILPHGVITMSSGSKSLDPLEILGLLLTSQKELLQQIDGLKSKLDALESGS